MTEQDVGTILQRAREKFPGKTPRIISDNGPQFITKEFKSFIQICGMTHVQTSLYFPQSNGKLERYHRTIKSECIRPGSPLCLDDARRIVAKNAILKMPGRKTGLCWRAPRAPLQGRKQASRATRVDES